MDSNQELSVIFGTSTQSFIDQIVRDASTPAPVLNGRIPCRTIAYKGYGRMVRNQRKQQKKPVKKVPHSTPEE